MLSLEVLTLEVFSPWGHRYEVHRGLGEEEGDEEKKLQREEPGERLISEGVESLRLPDAFMYLIFTDLFCLFLYILSDWRGTARKGSYILWREECSLQEDHWHYII